MDSLDSESTSLSEEQRLRGQVQALQDDLRQQQSEVKELLAQMKFLTQITCLPGLFPGFNLDTIREDYALSWTAREKGKVYYIPLATIESVEIQPEEEEGPAVLLNTTEQEVVVVTTFTDDKGNKKATSLKLRLGHLLEAYKAMS